MNSNITGSYGDSIHEMNWAVGEVMSTLKSSNIDEETVVIFLSANGPNKNMCTLGGSSGTLSGITMLYVIVSRWILKQITPSKVENRQRLKVG